MIKKMDIERVDGRLGQIMVHKRTGKVGVVTAVLDRSFPYFKYDVPEELTVKTKDGEEINDPDSDFEDATEEQVHKFNQ